MRVFVYGGCATRDAAEFYPEYGLELAGYIARQSVVSAFAPADLRNFNFTSIPSSFQRRMYAGDVTGNLLSTLRDRRRDYDVIFWDLNIERVGYTVIPSGGAFSGRQATKYWKGKEKLPPRVPFADDEHFSRWNLAVDQFLEALEAIGKREALVVNATPWAPLPPEAAGTRDMVPGQTAEWFNLAVEPYFAALVSRGVPLVRVPEEAAVAKLDHKWGPASFHYEESTYHRQLAQLVSTLGLGI